jgi:hypothetical protein
MSRSSTATPPPEPVDEIDAQAEGEALVEAAENRRRRARKAAGKPEAEPAAEPSPSTRRRRRAAPAPRDASVATEPGDEPPASAPPAASTPRPRGPGAWTAVLVCVALSVLVLSAAAASSLPKPLPVDQVQVQWLDGPRATPREVNGWLATFPERDQLAEANAWVMGRLSEHLLSRPGVGEVQSVRLRHDSRTIDGRTRAVRLLEVRMGMRRPFMPGVLASGARVWVDREGVVLPGSLPAPDRRRPFLRQIEAGSAQLRHAVEAWSVLEPQLEPGLVSTIECAAPLDERGAFGVVMTTVNGCRLVWGRPEDAMLGRDATARAADLVHTIRCQGDLSRIGSINVRFAKPFYTPR